MQPACSVKRFCPKTVRGSCPNTETPNDLKVDVSPLGVRMADASAGACSDMADTADADNRPFSC